MSAEHIEADELVVDVVRNDAACGQRPCLVREFLYLMDSAQKHDGLDYRTVMAGYVYSYESAAQGSLGDNEIRELDNLLNESSRPQTQLLLECRMGKVGPATPNYRILWSAKVGE